MGRREMRVAMQSGYRQLTCAVCVTLLAAACAATAAPAHGHAVGLGATKKMPYSAEGDPAGALEGEKSLAVRPLVVDGRVKEWTTGASHDITERSFVIRRAIRLNDTLPDEKGAKQTWVWQRGPWLLVDRSTGRITAMKLPDYDPAVSQVEWFRDYGAYCGVTPSGKSLYAVVVQVGARRPVLSKKLDSLDPGDRKRSACGPTEWQREPLRATFHPARKDTAGFDIVAGSAVLVEDSDDNAEPAQPKD